MPTFIKKLFENDEPVSIQKIVASLFGIVLIRTFLEFFSNPDPSGFIFGWETSYLHFPLFYFSTFLSFTLILRIFTKKNLDRIWNFLLPVFMLIWIPPIADLFLTSGKGAHIGYIATEPEKFFSLFLKFLHFSGVPGITIGLRITAFLVLSALALFILKATGSFIKAGFGVFTGYLILFVSAIIPSLVALPYFLHSHADSAINFYALALNHGLIQTTRQALPLLLTTTGQQNFFHAIFMAQVFWLLVVVQLFFIFIASNSKYRKILRDNFPATRIAYWSIIALIGIFISQKFSGNIDLSNITTLVSFGVIFLLGVLNTFFAICINDAEDLDIDIVSNPDRPLVKKELSSEQWDTLALILLFLIISGLATMNPVMAFFFILTQMAYYLYSARPLRLKRNFISSSVIIGLSSITVAMAGFFFVSPDQHLAAFPFKAIVLVGIIFALLSNIKDIKDFEGDRRENIKTMPVVFGLENSKKIIALLYALVFISIPLILNASSMLYFSIFCAIFTFYLFTKKQYQEKYIFLVLFLYAGMLFLTLI